MKRLNYLLTKLAEEASEVSQAALKCSLFGLDDHHPDRTTTNEDELGLEVIDLITVMIMLAEEFNLFTKMEEGKANDLYDKKVEKVNHYYNYILNKEKAL